MQDLTMSIIIDIGFAC